MDCASADAAVPRPTLSGPAAWKCYLSFFRDQLGLLASVQRQYGPLLVLRERLPGRSHVQGLVCSGGEFNQQVLSDPEVFQSGGTLIRGPRGSAQNRLRRGLVAINGHEHREKRRLVSPLFMPKATRQYYPAMSALVSRELDYWPLGRPVDVAALVSRMSLVVSAQNLLAGENSEEANRLAEITASCLRRAFKPSVWLFPVNVVGTPYWRLMKRANKLEAALLEMIARRKPSTPDSPHLFDRLISTHLAEPRWMTREDLLGQIIFMFSASHETIAKGVIWTLFLLSQHPRMAAELHDELRAALRRRTALAGHAGEFAPVGRGDQGVDAPIAAGALDRPARACGGVRGRSRGAAQGLCGGKHLRHASRCGSVSPPARVSPAAMVRPAA